MWVTVGSGEGKGLSVRVEGERFLIGSGAECQLMLGDPMVEPLHAYLEADGEGKVELHDLGSKSGTFVGGERVAGSRVLHDGDELRVGDTLLIATLEDPAREAAANQDGSESEDVAPAVRVTTEEGEAVEVVPVGEHRRLRERSTAALVAGGVALLLAIAGGIVALSSGGGGPSTASIVNATRGRTVFVHAKLPKGESSGSGWVLDASKGLIATDFHVIDGGTQFAVGMGQSARPATIVGAAPCDDLAVLRVADRSGLKTMPLGSQKGLKEGDSVVAVGYPANASLQDNLTSTAGVVSVVRSSFRFPTPDSPTYTNMIQTDAALSPGNSGGPLVDSDKKLVGVNTAILAGIGGEPVQGQGYAIGVDRVKQVMPDLRAGRSHGWAGFSVQAPKKSELARAGSRNGVLIGDVVPGTPAYAAGLRGGPVLVTQINGLALTPTFAGYCDGVRDVAPGQTAVLTVVAKPGAKPRQLALRF